MKYQEEGLYPMEQVLVTGAGSTISRLRKNKNISIERLAESANIKNETLRALENNGESLSRSEAEAISMALQMSLQEFALEHLIDLASNWGKNEVPEGYREFLASIVEGIFSKKEEPFEPLQIVNARSLFPRMFEN